MKRPKKLKIARSSEKEGNPSQERGQDSRLCWGLPEASPVFQPELFSVLRVPFRDTESYIANDFDAPGWKPSLIFLVSR